MTYFRFQAGPLPVRGLFTGSWLQEMPSRAEEEVEEEGGRRRRSLWV
jgi:hypothetical protein